MPKRATILRKTVWYQRYKNLAERLDGKGIADTLHIIHALLNSNFMYRSTTTAAAAHDSVEQVIKDLELGQEERG
jgi:hypothetical protein